MWHTHTRSCFTHSAPPEPGMTARLCLVWFFCWDFHTLPLTVVCSCLLWYNRELILYGLLSVLIGAKGFRFWLIWSALVWFWSSCSPQVPSRESQFFLYPLLHWTTMFWGCCSLSVYQWRYKYAYLLPGLICNTIVCTHNFSRTHKHTHRDPEHLPWRESQDWYSVIFLPPPASNQQMQAQEPVWSWRTHPDLQWNIYHPK